MMLFGIFVLAMGALLVVWGLFSIALAVRRVADVLYEVSHPAIEAENASPDITGVFKQPSDYR